MSYIMAVKKNGNGSLYHVTASNGGVAVIATRLRSEPGYWGNPFEVRIQAMDGDFFRYGVARNFADAISMLRDIELLPRRKYLGMMPIAA